MAESSQQQNVSSRPWRTHFLRWLWRGIGLFWSLIVIGIVVNVASAWLTSTKGFSPDSPVGLAFRNLPFTISLGIILLLLTLLIGLLYRQNAAHNNQLASPLPLPPQQSRDALIRMLRQEYTRRLTHSLQGAAMMVLGLHERTDLTTSTAQLVFRHSTIAGEHPLPLGTSIAQVYDDAGQGLLILGEPGAGKTTLLLDLARELLTRTQGNPLQPIPVIVNLTSWATKQLSLASWLIDQLQLVYQVPPRLGQAFLEHDQWLLLLDGLDEVEESARNGCIKAINTFRGDHFVPLVVCSRSREYLAQEARLILPSAVMVQPLEEQQVIAYLKQVGKPMMAVRAALRSNPTLQQLITTPLMLNVVILAYRDKMVDDIPRLGTVEEQQQQIFERYIVRMLEQRAVKGQVSSQQARKWLNWLAQHMKQHHLTEFYLERLQPEWLPTKRSRISYRLLAGLVAWLVIGLLFGLLNFLPFGLTSGGLSFVNLLATVLSGLGIGLLFGLPFTFRLFRNDEIRPTEVLVWSSKFWAWLLGSLLFGLIYGLAGNPPGGFFAALLLLLLIGLPIGLLAGLSGEQIAEHKHFKPNEGIRSSGWNALRLGLPSMLFIGLLFGLFGGLFTTPPGGLSGGLADGLLFGLLAGLFFGQRYGGRACLEHYILRAIFWRDGAMPWHYIRFLDEAAECILLQEVGGGYRFIHPLFLDYFASQGSMPSASV